MTIKKKCAKLTKYFCIVHPSYLTGKRNASNIELGPPPAPGTDATQVQPTTRPETTEHATSTFFTTETHSNPPETTGTAVQTTKGNRGGDKGKKLKETSDRIKKAKNVCKKMFFNIKLNLAINYMAL